MRCFLTDDSAELAGSDALRGRNLQGKLRIPLLDLFLVGFLFIIYGMFCHRFLEVYSNEPTKFVFVVGSTDPVYRHASA